MKPLVKSIDGLIQPLRNLSDNWLSPALDVGIRLYMAKIFFDSGMIKLGKWTNEGFDAVVLGFREYYPVPGIPAELAAVAGTAAELILPVLLVVGLFSRFAAAGLLIMSMVIQFAIPAEYGLQNIQHYFWMFLFAVILFKGPGKFSLDHFLLKWVRS
ncbi:MAG: DoxX family protein [Pseudomonadota bacterium]